MTDQPPAMTGAQIRQLYLDYFLGREHLVMPSSSLIPAGDPTLLLTTAGMVQMKPYFLGEVSPPSRRMTSAQKCFRTTDIDTVGDHKHLTFFEMLGNFSVGDYFKEGAIGFAWEFVTQRLGLDPGRLWVTVYLDDDEAYDLWRERIGVPQERIYRYGRGDNWWGPPGLEGPCGPCSEIHYDFGRALGCANAATAEVIAEWERGGNTGEQPGCHPNCDRCERFVELWNLVFMQFFQDTAKELTTLPAPNIDTGMGLERAAVILQNARTVYDTDLFQPIVQRVCELAVKEYGRDAETDRAVRVVAEHARGAAFLITDGVVPGNDGRGYVLRRLIRRAVRFGRKLGLTDAFLAQLAEVVVEQMGGAYPELAENREFVLRVLALEEERFGETLERGLLLFKGFRNEMTRIGAALREEQSTLPVTVAEEHDVLSVNKTAFFLGPEQRLVRGDSQMTEAELSGAQLVHDVLIDRFDLFEYYEGYLGLKLPMNPSTFAEAFSSVSVETAAKFPGRRQASTGPFPGERAAGPAACPGQGRLRPLRNLRLPPGGDRGCGAGRGVSGDRLGRASGTGSSPSGDLPRRRREIRRREEGAHLPVPGPGGGGHPFPGVRPAGAGDRRCGDSGERGAGGQRAGGRRGGACASGEPLLCGGRGAGGRLRRARRHRRPRGRDRHPRAHRRADHAQGPRRGGERRAG